MDRKKQAILYHQMYGYNCAQSVVMAYADIVDIDKNQLFKCCEAFGLGMGNMQGICGALSGALVIASLLESNGNISEEGPKTKAHTYKVASTLQTYFTQKTGAVYCKDLKNPRSETFTPCDTCIEYACDVLDHYLSDRN